jgi:uncharacterized protein (TIGR03000 family)
MNRSQILALAVAVSLAGATVAAPPPSAGPAPYFGTPGTAGTAAQFSYPAPGAYGSTSFRPYSIPPLSGRTLDPLANLPDEWPAVGPARITVKLPADAKLFVDGRATKQTGAVREFVTPPTLVAGLSYQYKLRAEWPQDGQTVTREQVVRFRVSGRSEVDFTQQH